MPPKLPVVLFLLRAVFATPYLRLKNVPVEVEPAHPGSSEFWTKLFVSVVLVLAGGVFAG